MIKKNRLTLEKTEIEKRIDLSNDLIDTLDSDLIKQLTGEQLYSIYKSLLFAFDKGKMSHQPTQKPKNRKK